MTQQPLNDHLDQLGAGLASAERRAERRRRRAIGGGAAGTFAAAVALGALVAVPGGARLDPVERARAALAADGAILHWEMATDQIVPGSRLNGKPNPNPPAIALWTATSGADRWRMRQPANGLPRFCGLSVLVSPQGLPTRSAKPQQTTELVSPTEYSFSPDRRSSYSPFSKAMVVVQIDQASRSSEPPGPGLLNSSLGAADPRDPVQAIRQALERGLLRDAGLTSYRGRQVRKLVGRVEQQMSASSRKRKLARGEIIRPNELTYYVDSATYAPVELQTRRYSVWSRAGGYRHYKWVTNIERFTAFERLADTPENRRLLDIQPPPGTVVETVSGDGTRVLRGPQGRLGPAATKAALDRCYAANPSAKP